MVSYSVRGAIAVVTINRPEVRNAVDGPTATALAEAFRRFDADAALSIAILTGSDGAFCAGADLKAISDARGNRVTADGDGPLGCTRMLLSKPVIAAVEGHAVAGGLELALWCDLRVAARDAVFGVYCRRWGVPLVDGGTIRLPRLIGQSHAFNMIHRPRSWRRRSAPHGPRRPVPWSMERRSPARDSPRRGAGRACRRPAMRNDRLSAIEQWDLGWQRRDAQRAPPRHGDHCLRRDRGRRQALCRRGGTTRIGRAGLSQRHGHPRPELPARLPRQILRSIEQFGTKGAAPHARAVNRRAAPSPMRVVASGGHIMASD